MVDATGFEEQLVLQSRVRINAGLTLLALGVYTQLALVLKKKQFEPKLVGAATPYLPVKYALTAPWMHWRLDRRVLTVNWSDAIGSLVREDASSHLAEDSVSLVCASVWATDGLSPDMSWRMEIIYSVRGALIAAFGN